MSKMFVKSHIDLGKIFYAVAISMNRYKLK